MRRPTTTAALILGVLLLAGTLCGGLLYGVFMMARQEALNNLDAQQEMLARQAAKGLQDDFAGLRHVAWAAAQNSHVVDLDADGERYLDNVLAENAREVMAISRLTTDGRIVFSTPDSAVIGHNLNDQAHVRRILTTHEPVVSDLFVSAQGYRTVSLHVPVYKEDRFAGTLGLLLNFDAIARRYLEGVGGGASGYAFLLSQNGVLLYSPVPGLAGRSHAEITRGFPEMRALVDRMLAGESGSASYVFNRVRDMRTNDERKRAVFLPIHLGDTFWSVCVAAP